jgi:membrane-associated protein
VQEYLQPLLNWLSPLLTLLSADEVVRAGYGLMTAIIFAETGLLIGFFLPGDSLLVTAGILASRPDTNMSILWINLLLIPAAIIGDTVGYWIGYRSGPRLFRREKSLLFHPEHLRAAQRFYERHGGKTIVLARFMPIVRTFAPVVAGMGRMDYRRFLFYNVFGGAGWILSMSLTGYLLGQVFPGAVRRLDFIIAVVVFVSILPGIITYINKRRKGPPPRDDSHGPLEDLVEALAAPDGE